MRARRSVALRATGLLALLVVGCGAETLEERACPPGGTKLTYENWGRGFFERECVVCHGGANAYSSRSFTTVLGIGPGIRHRAGGGARVGVEVPFSTSKSLEWVALGALEGTWLGPRILGPSSYYGVTAGIGINYRVAELP